MPTTKKQMEWKKENGMQIGIYIPNKSGIPDALLEAIELEKTTKNAYCLKALRNQLAKDGYLHQILDDPN